MYIVLQADGIVGHGKEVTVLVLIYQFISKEELQKNLNSISGVW